jgi:hypothetical protein
VDQTIIFIHVLYTEMQNHIYYAGQGVNTKMEKCLSLLTSLENVTRGVEKTTPLYNFTGQAKQRKKYNHLHLVV